MNKEVKNGFINVFVSFLWTVFVIFSIVGGVSVSRLLWNGPTTFLGWAGGLFGLLIYLAGCLIVWYFAFDSIATRYKWIKK